MKSLMLTTERYFATTLIEAESLVKQKKEEFGTSIKQHIITKRQKKDLEFYIVTITTEFYKVAELTN